MTREEIGEQVNEIVSNQLNVSKDQITDETSFINDLGADSLDTVELVMELEDRFDMTIPDEEAEQIQTVGRPENEKDDDRNPEQKIQDQRQIVGDLAVGNEKAGGVDQMVQVRTYSDGNQNQGRDDLAQKFLLGLDIKNIIEYPHDTGDHRSETDAQ